MLCGRWIIKECWMQSHSKLWESGHFISIRLILCHGLCLWWMLSFMTTDATHLISEKKNNTLTVNVNIGVYGSTMNNCDIIKGTSSYTLFTCIDHINQREGNRNREGDWKLAVLPLPSSLEGRHHADKSQCLNPNASWQCVSALTIFCSLWCQSSISPMTFFQRKSRFPRDSTLCNFHSLLLNRKMYPSFLFSYCCQAGCQ